MSYYIRLLCNSNAPLTQLTLVDFIKEGVYFEKPLVFIPAPSHRNETVNPDWKELVVQYDPVKRPIFFYQNCDDSLVPAEIEEIADVVQGLNCEKQTSLLKHLHTTRRIIAIEVDLLDLSEEAWEMMTSIEMYLARLLDGIIFAPEDGFYDSNLQLICGCQHRSQRDGE